MDEQRINVVKSILHQISTYLAANPFSWASQVPSALSLLPSLDASTLMDDRNRKEEQIWVIQQLQNLAYADPDSGGVTQIADWCLSKWLIVLSWHSDEVRVLQGIGHWWLLKAQPSLARVHALDGSSSSSSGSTTGSRSHGLLLSRSEEDRQAAGAAAEAEMRVNTSDYVEARGLLVPATEYLARAVQWAVHHGTLDGNLLALAAEAYISLGNVSSERVNEQYFRQALYYLRRATEMPGYQLNAALQQYLDDLGRFVD